jgi:hypothetical protein
VRNSGSIRRIIGALLAAGVLAALVSPTAASPLVRKTHRAVVDSSSTAGAAPLPAGDAVGYWKSALWLIEPIGAEQHPDWVVCFCAGRRGAPKPGVLAHSAFGSRPPPAAV